MIALTQTIERVIERAIVRAIKSGKQRNIDAGCFGKQWIIDQFNIEQNAADKVND